VGLAVVDEEHRYRYANQRYIEILNLPSQNIIGQLMVDLHPCVYEDQIRPALREAFRGQRIQRELVIRGIAPESRERHCLAFYEHGKLPAEKATLLVLVDITDRKEAEEATNSVARFPFENPNPVLRIGTNGVLLYANDASYKLLSGWYLEIGKPAPRPLREAAADASATRKPTVFDSEHNERIFSFSVVPIRAAGYVNFYAQEITGRRRIEEELRQQAALLDLAPVFVRDMANRIVFWGHGAQQLYGYSSKEATGRNCLELLRTELPLPLGEIFNMLRRRGTWERELIRYTRDGSRIVVASRWVLYADAKGRPARILEVDTDMTQRKEMEENIKQWNTRLEETVLERTANLRAAKEQAEHADRAKSEFLANMSHELRTPLNAIIGFSQILIDGRAGPLSPLQKEYLSDVLASGHHLLNLVSDILDLTRISAGKLELSPQLCSLRQIIDRGCATVKPMPSQKNITIKTDMPAGDDLTCLDPVRLMQVLQNLLSNAVKFTPENGTVHVTVSLDEKMGVRLQVKDTGIGISKEDLPRLFNAFEQGDSGFAKRQQGTGLGLALTKKIIELQQGSISVESEPGKGSTFTVILPSAQTAVVNYAQAPA
jgi:PAS domain S-box-containing protein